MLAVKGDAGADGLQILLAITGKRFAGTEGDAVRRFNAHQLFHQKRHLLHIVENL